MVLYHNRIFRDQEDFFKQHEEETGEKVAPAVRRDIDIGIKELKQNGEK